jgi:hypothetical protein
MDADTLRLLEAADDPGACESPEGFDWAAEMAKVRALQPILEHVAGRKLSLDTNVQDASFFTSLDTYDPVRTPGGTLLNVTWLGIRFSSFGRLFSIRSVADASGQIAPVPDAIMRNVIDTVIRAGYVYVAADALDAPYTGKNPHIRGTWWIRFFDYL